MSGCCDDSSGGNAWNVLLFLNCDWPESCDASGDDDGEDDGVVKRITSLDLNSKISVIAAKPSQRHNNLIKNR